MNAFEKAVPENGQSSGSVKNSSRDKPEVVEKLNDTEELGGESKPMDVITKSDEDKKPVEIAEERVLKDVKNDRKHEREKKEEEKGQKEEDKEQIGFLDVDEIVSDSGKTMIKTDNTLASMSDRVFDEDVLEYMMSLGINCSADNLELYILKMPPLQLVTAETKTIRESRRIIIYPVSLVDMSHSTVQKILASKSCVDFTVKCNRTGDCEAWNGCAILTFLTSSDAMAAAGELRQMRESLNIEQGSSVDSKFAELQQNLPKEDWTEAMLVAKNIGYSTSENVLKEIFPDADVVIHKNLAGSTSRGHAYLLFSSAEKANEVLVTYSEKKLEINGRRFILLKYRRAMQSSVPDGMLRIGERRLVMQNLEETEANLEKSLAKKYQQAKINFLRDLIGRDDSMRKLCGLPLPTYNQLKKLRGLHQMEESKVTKTLYRLLGPFYKEREKDKDIVREREREGEREKKRQRNQESTAKDRVASRGKKASPHLDNSSLMRPPLRRSTTPILPTKRKIVTGKQQQQQQQQRTAMVRPLRSAQPPASRSYNDEEPCSKTCRYSSMESDRDEDSFSQIYTDPNHRVLRAKDYDDGQPWLCNRGGDRGDRGERDDDLYRYKELLSSAFRSLDVTELFRDERSLRRSESHQGTRSMRVSLPHHKDEGRRGKYRRCDEREERRLRDSRGRSNDRLSRQEVDSSKRQSSSSNSAKADPVGLLLNLSQLLTEKLQRFKKKEKGKRGGGH